MNTKVTKYDVQNKQERRVKKVSYLRNPEFPGVE